ncbi:MAG TPA: DUF302 domain-containing protein [Acidobacteriaceae bacterium]|jgi:hypothetical protein|nr:DUF302 domain-containing protein [Acidobacteriaceae bacterium]
MNTLTIEVQRISIVSTRSFTDVLARIDLAIGHPDMREFIHEIQTAPTDNDLEAVVNRAIGPSGFMEFARYDLGAVIRKQRGSGAPQIVRLVAGNPLIMRTMVGRVPDAGSYAPITILIDERSDGVHLTYDRMQSLLAPYGDLEASRIGADLDAKVEKLLTEAARG